MTDTPTDLPDTETPINPPDTEVPPPDRASDGGSGEQPDPDDPKAWHMGQAVSPDVDGSFHAYEFTDPKTGEVLENRRTIHEVPVGTNEDGSVIMERPSA